MGQALIGPAAAEDDFGAVGPLFLRLKCGDLTGTIQSIAQGLHRLAGGVKDFVAHLRRRLHAADKEPAGIGRAEVDILINGFVGNLAHLFLIAGAPAQSSDDDAHAVRGCVTVPDTFQKHLGKFQISMVELGQQMLFLDSLKFYLTLDIHLKVPQIFLWKTLKKY